jgi:hypothetical protein
MSVVVGSLCGTVLKIPDPDGSWEQNNSDLGAVETAKETITHALD